MAKFQLNPGETLIGSGTMAYQAPWGLSFRNVQGKVYVTNQRACFVGTGSGLVCMDHSIGELKGFSVRKTLFITAVTIHSRSGERYTMTGFPAKALQTWLSQAGVTRL